MKPLVSVIVPVYNVEKFIGECVRSLFAQTLEEVEFIFVNDCTPDGSMEVVRKIMEEFPGRADAVK
ncbi:MAG: glycosyltransferase, partial [Bacteroidales bacterium]|nr:glycosyltransferase [Bacteroidales bacterium]